MGYHTQAAKTLSRNGWRPRHGVMLLVGLTAAFIATWPAWVEMAYAAVRYDNARTSILVIPIVAWLVWVRRARFRFVRPGGTALGWIVLIAGVQFYVMGQYVYGLRSPWHFGAVLIVAGVILACTGKSLFQHFRPAWAILPLLVPVPGTLTDLIAKPIQLFEAEAIAAIYSLFGVSVEVLSSPGVGRVVVGDAVLNMDIVCKGLPTMLSLLLISYGFVFSSPMRPIVRAVLLVIAPAVALVCSAIALGGTLWLYDGHSTLLTADLIRAFSEWATLLIAFLLIAGSLRLLVWASVPVHQYHLASTSP
ncbi:MAG: archaeosortase/exosortase family protein [Phycisphaeraceae bacterium]